MLRKLGAVAIASGVIAWSAGSAQAQMFVDGWTLDLTQVPGLNITTQIDGIDQFLFGPIRSRVVLQNDNGNMIPDPGENYRVVGQGNFTGFANENGNIPNVPINFTNPNSGGFQISFVFDVTVEITSVTNGLVAFDNQFGSLTLFVDNLDPVVGTGAQTPGNIAAGTDDGVQVAQFNLLPIDGGDIDLSGVQAGQEDATFVLDSIVDPNLLLDSSGDSIAIIGELLADIDENLDVNAGFGPLGVPFNTDPSAPSNVPFGALPPFASPADFMAQSDGSGILRLPEPATLGLMGIGLLGIGLGLRRRRKAAA